MNSSEETCLLCLSTNKSTIKFYSDTGKELNIMSILSTHFWFQLDEIKVLSQNICYDCWHKTEAFHEFYQSVRLVHKKFETVFVKVEPEQEEDVEDDRVIEHHNNVTDFLKVENDHEVEVEVEEDEEILEIPYTNSIDTETRAFESLPKRTQSKYLRAYEKFAEWKAGENIEKDCFSEAVMLEYFYYLKSKYKPTSLWVEYSMLRTTIQRNDNINITYPEISLLLKKSSVGYQKHKTNVFQPDEIRRFLSEAEDIKYLAVKVIAIFGIYGATHGETLTKVDVDDVTEQGSVFVIKIPETRTKAIRSFTLENEHAAYVQKYKKLRPENIQHNRFFLNYQNGKCTLQPIGKNKFLHTPKIIAKFLNLKDADNYSSYSFRRDGTQTATNKNKDDTSVLPVRSREKYIRSYDKFLEWKTDEDIDKECFSEEVMLQYFRHLKTKYQPSSLLGEYSMLRATIQKNHNIDINYPELTTSLKFNSVRFQPQKMSYVFQTDEMQRFLHEAPDREFLVVKVIMIFGIYGVTQGDTLTKVNVNDVSEQGSVLVVKIPETKTNAIRSFTLENEYAACVKKYKKLRPDNVTHGRFFIYYQNGKCMLQPIGKNKFLEAPKTIAKFLHLNDPENYTSYSFRRKSPKHRRGMRSTSILNTYIEECIPSKRKCGEEIQVENEDEISEDTNLKTSPETMVVSDTIISSMDTSTLELLPGKSRERYKHSYEKFFAWKTEENIDKECFSEDVLLDYFNHLKTKFKPSSLRSEYSMLRTSIQKNDNIDISYPKMKQFLKEISIGFEPQKFLVFRPDELQRFLSEAEDIKFLAAKVIMIFGMYGAANDLTKVDVKDVIEEESMTVIKAPDRRTKAMCSFTLDKEHAAYVQKYKKLRPTDTPHTRFFVNYQNGKCTVQPIGMNKILHTPKVVANFLNLDPENYTSYSFSGMPKEKKGKKSKKLLADGGLNSLSIADSCVEEQVPFKRPTTSTITSSMDTSTTSNVPNAFQTYHQLHHLPPSATATSTIPTAFQSYVQPHQIQSYSLLPYGTSTVNLTPNDGYVAPDTFR